MGLYRKAVTLRNVDGEILSLLPQLIDLMKMSKELGATESSQEWAEQLVEQILRRGDGSNKIIDSYVRFLFSKNYFIGELFSVCFKMTFFVSAVINS
jgi:hypothetical protein